MMGRTFLHYARVLAGRELPQTQTTEAERGLLFAHLQGRKRIVEIGVFEGFTTRLLAEHSEPDAIVYGVDPFFTGRVAVSWGLLIARAYNRAHLARGKLRLVRAFSTQVGDAVPATVDYVFIDGDHSLEAIRADWDFWSARVVPGGIIALHDTLIVPGVPEFGSHRYFRDHIQHDSRFEIVGQVDSLTVLRKSLAR
jgi:predicted O-methyltransferase YrrM